MKVTTNIYKNISSSVPHILPHGCRVLLRVGRPSDGQHREGHVPRVAEGRGGDHAAPPPHHGLPHHHQPPCPVLRAAVQHSLWSGPIDIRAVLTFKF